MGGIGILCKYMRLCAVLSVQVPNSSLVTLLSDHNEVRKITKLTLVSIYKPCMSFYGI